MYAAMKTELQNAWLEYCKSGENRIDRNSFVAGWEACERIAARSIDELAFMGRQMAGGVSLAQVEAELAPRKPSAA